MSKDDKFAVQAKITLSIFFERNMSFSFDTIGVYQFIKRSEDIISAVGNIGSGKAKIMTKGNITKLKRLMDHTDHIFQSKLAIKFD